MNQAGSKPRYVRCAMSILSKFWWMKSISCSYTICLGILSILVVKYNALLSQIIIKIKLLFLGALNEARHDLVARSRQR